MPRARISVQLPPWTNDRRRAMTGNRTACATSPLPAPVCRDPNNKALLALAVAGNADPILSADADLSVLGGNAGIPIVKPAEALAWIVG